MNEKPILFTGEMVQAILREGKTQTRRAINFDRLRVVPRRRVQSDPVVSLVGAQVLTVEGGKSTKAIMNAQGAVCGIATNGERLGLKPGEFDFACPYCEGETILEHGRGWRILPKAGSFLWVRETWKASVVMGWTGEGTRAIINYRAGGDSITHKGDFSLKPARGEWRPSIFMPRWASRIQLQVPGVRLQRLQEITTCDIVAEGLRSQFRGHDAAVDLKEQFRKLWDSINAKRGYGWDENPWVWAVKFERVKG